MNRLLKAATATLQAVGINAVPVVGMFAAGWSVETAILLYLLENLVGIPLVALLVRLLAPPTAEVAGQGVRRRDEILRTYLLVAVSFSLGSAIFIAFVILRTSNGAFDFTGVWAGLSAISMLALLGFLADLVFLRPLSLPRAEKVLERSLGRIFVLYLAVFIGIFVAVFGLASFFVPFVILKTLMDIGFLFQAFARPRGAVASMLGVEQENGFAGTADDGLGQPPSLWSSAKPSWKRRAR